MQRLVAFIKVYPQYTIESVLAMPWHRYITMCRINQGVDNFPEHFARMGGYDALSHAERILEQVQRSRERHGLPPLGGSDDG